MRYKEEHLATDWITAGDDGSLEEQLGKEQLQDMKADGMLDRGLQHVATREYYLQCNWKVFADNYLVRLESVTWLDAVYEDILVMPSVEA